MWSSTFQLCIRLPFFVFNTSSAFEAQIRGGLVSTKWLQFENGRADPSPLYEWFKWLKSFQMRPASHFLLMSVLFLYPCYLYVSHDNPNQDIGGRHGDTRWERVGKAWLLLEESCYDVE